MGDTSTNFEFEADCSEVYENATNERIYRSLTHDGEPEPHAGSSLKPEGQECIIDFFIYYLEDGRRITTKLQTFLKKKNYLCKSNDSYIPGHTYIDNFTNCFLEAKVTIFVVSPEFLKSGMSIFLSQMTVQHFAEKKKFDLIVIQDRVSSKNVPKHLQVLPKVKTKYLLWCSRLLLELENTGKYHHICTADSHVDSKWLVNQSPTTKSDPTPLRDIPDSLKRRNQEILVAMGIKDGPIKKELEKVVKCDDNLEFFYKLKAAQKKTYEMTKNYSKGEITLFEGEVVEVVSPYGETVTVKNRENIKIKISRHFLTPITGALPSMEMQKFFAPITAEENDRFQKELESMNIPYYVSKDTLITEDDKFKIHDGDVLQMISQHIRVKVINARNQKGYISTSAFELLNS